MLAAAWFVTAAPCHAAEQNDLPPLRAAIFLQNRDVRELNDKLDMLSDMISTRLTEKGFSIIDRNIVLSKFREARNLDDKTQKDLKKLTRDMEGNGEGEGGGKPGDMEDALSNASALRIAQMIGADYLVVASVASLGHEARSFNGEGTLYKTTTSTDIFTLRVALKVLEGNSGGSVYGDMVTTSERVASVARLKIESNDIINKLMDSSAVRIAENIGGRINAIRTVKVKAPAAVEFTIQSNMDGATVELDGAVIGSTPGRFSAAPGLHQLRISKQWMNTWDRTVNIIPNQMINVTLQLSEDGARRFANIERLKQELERDKKLLELEGKEREANIELGAMERKATIEINKEQSSADAYAKKKIAEGEKKRREESFERIESSPTTIIYK